MGNIRILSAQLANKIAAGEVIERPASVVKELIENSLDAHANTITVAVSHGGKRLIKVTDDGCGMDREDAANCLLRHATSKISSAEDIERIQTLGFRGEALASIAAISRVTLTTRQPEASIGTSLKATGGIIDSVAEGAAQPGTTLEVADLFFNTPVRKKFFKSEGAEYAAIAEVFDTIALSCPTRSFALYKNGFQAAGYVPCETVLQRIEQIYSPEVSEKLHPLALDHTEVNISGYIGTPDNTRINRSGQKYFINRRPVRSISLSLAVGRAYEEIIPRDRFPVAILFFEIDPAAVDVNIHPAKREVRILNERFLQDLLIKAIRKTFAEKGIYPQTTVKPPGYYYREVASPGSRAPFSFAEVREAVSRWEAPQELLAETSMPAALPLPDKPSAAWQQALREDKPFGILRVLGQIQGTYIIAETADGLALLDQHAAHERIIYEEILQGFRQRAPQSQSLLFPQTLHLDLKERSTMEQYLPDFQKLGFGINSLGGGSFSIDAVPVCLSQEDSSQALKDTLNELMEESLSQSREQREQALAAALACKTRTVKAGRTLAPEEMLHLIQKLGTTRNPHTCPHGRPTLFWVTTQEIEKRFKRR